MEVWIPVIVALIPSVIAIIKYFIDRKDKKENDTKNIEDKIDQMQDELIERMDGYLTLARDRYDDFFVSYASNEIGLCYTLMKSGLELDEENMVNIRNLYKAYHEAGHNGHVEALYNKIEKLYAEQNKKENDN